MSDFLTVSNLNKSFHIGTPDEVRVFKNFNLSSPKGEFISIIGSNGSGKSTLLNLISGTLKPDSGKIILSDRGDTSKLSESSRYKTIGRVFQNPSMGTAGNLTVLENLSLAANKGKFYGLGLGYKTRDRDLFRESLKKLNMGLENYLDQKTGNLSGGQRQALALLMTSLSHASLVLLDEHTAALDPKSSDRIMELTQELVDTMNCTVLMVTHNLRYALQYGDRIIMMHQGKIVLDKQGQDKKNLQLDDIVGLFADISIELGN
ncbi:ABC transporter ATP-binding protein [Taylorella equigenitalis]|uniref:ABC transporter, ATP binding protein n=2 Tax=Taylorella equigenitalis TaxID=29575 RepID=A0ABN4AYF9_9BURK|nr:ATP-binding cassette domain-containing protein [Taylorella equigenitalis]AFN35944.1 ABC transporter, ATP binding protein [Taylorella equigenitalis ATCC 35865]ASY30578.1 ABC transporter ATP-binding protein [Taylorella equigenitalis]ASY37885.1 ABC transporter ATP-binding protein [Taylorella equigenitalis]ASY39353.1 ABC transporter ATP-binding protein [Taylorella equigenitalis]ASY40871.1 ABC transporter ATP-binding protein [Taylorella equigenitalis]